MFARGSLLLFALLGCKPTPDGTTEPPTASTNEAPPADAPAKEQWSVPAELLEPSEVELEVSSKDTTTTPGSNKSGLYETPPKGSADKEVIRRVVRENLQQIRDCYAAGLARTAGAKGRVEVTFLISASGEVRQSTIRRNDTGDAQLGECIAAAARTWKFPAPEDGGDVVVTYPFVLEPNP